MEHVTLFVTLIIFLGISAQWLAWWFSIPAIILLLAIGLIVGPVTGIIAPSEVFGDLLNPFIEFAVAIIVFEGGLLLRRFELREVGTSVKRLIIIGIPITITLGTIAVYSYGGMSFKLSLLLAGILVVTGPTVIIPLLRHVGIDKRVGNTAKWEGIITDPIGVLITALIYQSIILTTDGEGFFSALFEGLINSVGIALVLGIGGSFLITQAFKRNIVPEFLKIPLILSLLLVFSSVAEEFQNGTGLLVATAMGVYLGNCQLPILAELKKFKESITIFTISFIFIVLSAELKFSLFTNEVLWRGLILVIAFFFIRIISVFVATIKTNTTWREKLLLSWFAPRGIVAASISGLFAHKLILAGHADAQLLVPYVFMIIFATVIFYSSTLQFLANKLGLAVKRGNGVVIIGTNPWTIELANTLKSLGIKVLLNDSLWSRITKARQLGLSTHYGELIADMQKGSLDLYEYGLALAATENDSYNALVCTKLSSEFGWGAVYQLPSEDGVHSERLQELPLGLSGNKIYDSRATYEKIIVHYYHGWRFTKTNITEEFSLDDLLENRKTAIHLLKISSTEEIEFINALDELSVGPGDIIVSFTPESEARSHPELEGELEIDSEAD